MAASSKLAIPFPCWIERTCKIYWPKAINCTVQENSNRPLSERILIDKNPLNLLYQPLIRALFPTAKMLMAVRDPLDVCISNFMQAFTPNVFMVHMKDLASTAKLCADYMALWRTAFNTIGQWKNSAPLMGEALDILAADIEASRYDKA